MNYGKQGIRKQQLKMNARGPKWSHKITLLIIEIVLVAIIAVGVFGCAFGVGLFKGILSTAPDISKVTVTPSKVSSFVYDTDGNQIAKLVSANANRIIVTSDQIPDMLKKAIVAIEDQRFYTHNGIDIRGIARAGFKALKQGHLGQGASTITQQLLKNNVFTEWASEENNVQKIKRKVQEQYLAIQLEKEMSKDEILTNYLNTINMGHSTLGVQSASLCYFGKDVSELTVAECALLAGITQNPSAYDPINHPVKSRERQELVLSEMYKQGMLTDNEYSDALDDPVFERIEYHTITTQSSGITSYFVDALIEQIEDDLLAAGYSENQVYSIMYSGGIRVNSTMDSRIQQICDEEVNNSENYLTDIKWYLNYRLTVKKADDTLKNYSSEMFRSYFRKNDPDFNNLFKSEEAAYEAIEKYQQHVLEEGDTIYAESISITPQPQVSVSIIDQETGYVKAMIGGRGAKTASRTFNRATQSARQPGSCFKVLTAFGPAIDSEGMTLATTYNDAPFNYNDGTPVCNWYGADVYKGICNLRYGIYYSLNVVAIKNITQITPQLGFQYASNLGFSTLETSKIVGDKIYTDITQSLALGGLTNGVYNIELCAAYASIANQGIYIEPKLYTTIEDADGNILIDNRAPITHRTFSEQTCFLLTDAMKDCVTIGTGTRAYMKDMAVAGKTGTTSNSRDVWFAGFTPYYTGCLWCGYDNNEILDSREERIPQVLFKAIMTRVHEGFENIGFKTAEEVGGIEKVLVCRQSGLLPVEGLCIDCYEEYFTADTVPTEPCNIHYQGTVCPIDGLIACGTCPFACEGQVLLEPVEDESLWPGSTVIVTDEFDPLNTVTFEPHTTNYCHHDEEFFAQPNWEEILNNEYSAYQQRMSLEQLMREHPEWFDSVGNYIGPTY